MPCWVREQENIEEDPYEESFEQEVDSQTKEDNKLGKEELFSEDYVLFESARKSEGPLDIFQKE